MFIKVRLRFPITCANNVIMFDRMFEFALTTLICNITEWDRNVMLTIEFQLTVSPILH